MEKKIIAENGIPLYTYRNPHSHSFYISLFLLSGSMYESDSEAGITHFFEHISIRNVNHLMDGGLYALLDRYGLEFNASTYNEMVQFYISGSTEHYSVAVDIISRLLCPVELPKSEIDAERARIRAEIREAGDRTTLQGFTQEWVWRETSLSRSIMGSLGTISKIGKRALESYRRRVFTKDNLFFYLTGNVTEEMTEELSRAVGGYQLSCGEQHRNIAPVPRNFGSRGADIRIKNADFTSLRLTFDVDMSKVTVQELDLLYLQLVGGYSSDFYIELSEKRGLFYDLMGATERYANVGTISFTYELREAKLYEALVMTVDILSRFKASPLARDRYLTATYVDNAFSLLDDNAELNFTFAYDNHVMSLGYSDLAARREAYLKVTPERIMEVARQIFTPDNLTLTMKGNKRRIDTGKLYSILNEL